MLIISFFPLRCTTYTHTPTHTWARGRARTYVCAVRRAGFGFALLTSDIARLGFNTLSGGVDLCGERSSHPFSYFDFR